MRHKLLQLPDNKPAVYERPAIIKALIDNGYAHTNLAYSRHDFEEVYHFLRS
ncbi:hypothetical protein CLV51_102138 [Chitinophaga niastensis]|uniref:Uncharacterized protein n=1 Tax=Chitinophaga niastensis TaxID=536980 RepID=A0A2P8HM54_CHINA|nr:hypothetical protein [Chitinophaga niastensis]PSL47293.1 hypothetical protein CLV51_102138 [Chitinophaga niastensis]